MGSALSAAEVDAIAPPPAGTAPDRAPEELADAMGEAISAGAPHLVEVPIAPGMWLA